MVRCIEENISLSREDHADKLRSLGIDANESEIYTPIESTIAYLCRFLPHVKRVGLLGTPSLCHEFEQAGFSLTWEHPDVVVVGFDMTLTYERLCRAAYWISTGLPFLATHPDLVCPTDEATVLVDCGSICACLTAATGRQALTFGKPNPSILLELCERLRVAPDQLLMVGDRIYTDIKMAREAGAQAVLVLTGETTRTQGVDLSLQPDWIVADIGQLGELLLGAQDMSV
jgi:NagD protein